MANTLFKLSTGASIPALGLGERIKPVFLSPTSSTYKNMAHIDCAYVYGNEDEVGEGLKESFESGAVKREDIFVTTKLWCTYHSRVEENLNMSLRSLGLDYLDLYLMYWPCSMRPNGDDLKFSKHPDGSRDLDASWTHIEMYQQMERLLQTGKAKAIWVANY